MTEIKCNARNVFFFQYKVPIPFYYVMKAFFNEITTINYFESISLSENGVNEKQPKL